ncbi:MAG: ParB/RepB/Spo0J family partition protein [Gammaproteobacteria bacterium]
MSAKKRGLGRGLDALLGLAGDAVLEEAAAPRAVEHIAIDRIRKGRYQPRLELRPEGLQELADSIRAQGVVQPVVVRPLEGGRGYELIAGERRWRAARLAGLDAIPALIREVPDAAALSIALIENIQREDLSPLEEGTAFSKLVKEFGMTHQAVAEAVGRSRAAVSNLLRLLDLEADVKTLLERGEIEMGHARALLALSGGVQIEAAQHIVAKGLTVREAEKLVRRALEATPAAEPVAKRPTDPDVTRLEGDLSERLGARVRLRHNGRGRGSLVIHYGSLDELDGILGHIQ